MNLRSLESIFPLDGPSAYLNGDRPSEYEVSATIDQGDGNQFFAVVGPSGEADVFADLITGPTLYRDQGVTSDPELQAWVAANFPS